MASAPKRSLRIARIASWDIRLAPLPQSSRRGKVARSHDRLAWLDFEREWPWVRRRNLPFEFPPVECAGFANLVLQVNDRLNDLLRPRWAAGYVDVDRHESIHSLDHGIGVEHAAARCTGAHRDTPLGLRHLQPNALKHGQHLHD